MKTKKIFLTKGGVFLLLIISLGVGTFIWKSFAPKPKPLDINLVYRNLKIGQGQVQARIPELQQEYKDCMFKNPIKTKCQRINIELLNYSRRKIELADKIADVERFNNYSNLCQKKSDTPENYCQRAKELKKIITAPNYNK